jgi:hypothetical protein
MAISSKGTNSADIIGVIESGVSEGFGRSGIVVWLGSGVQVSGKTTGVLVGALLGLSVAVRGLQAADKNTTTIRMRMILDLLLNIKKV